jgi:broad specificity phosphatase PhoE
VTTTIFLLRHAAHEELERYLAGRSVGVNLGASGLAQARQLAARLEREQFSALFVSPRERAQQTAFAIAAVRGDMPIETVEALDEVDFGFWSGCTFDELNQRDDWQLWNAHRSMAETPAGESMLDVQRRAVDFIRQIAFGTKGARIALVSHAEVIRAIVGHLLGLPIDAWQRFEIAPASITTMVIGDWGGKLLTLNEITP